VVAFSVLKLHEVAMANFYYWIFWWYDIMMHTLGGFLIGGIVVWGYHRFFERTRLSNRELLVLVVSGAVIVGSLWEILEYFSGIYAQIPNVVLDTIKDLCDDALGAALAYLCIDGVYRRALRVRAPDVSAPHTKL
jgi:uncharacterized BrkB/YihY/UPF0761 family membrane protein